jgi:hypothetical protein
MSEHTALKFPTFGRNMVIAAHWKEQRTTKAGCRADGDMAEMGLDAPHPPS